MAFDLITDLYFSDTPLNGLCDRHEHNVYQLLYIVQGSVCCEIAGNKINCKAPALLFIGNYEPHVFWETSKDYARYVMTLAPYRLNTQLKPDLLHTVFSFHPAGFAHALDITPIAEEVRMRMDDLLHEWSLPADEKLAGGEALLLSALLYSIRRFSPAHFAKKSFGSAELTAAAVRMELECNFTQKLNLDELAARYHVSRYYLAHIFKKSTGSGLKEYLMLCRISFACQELASHINRPIGDIAEAAGFRDMSNFSRYFKQTIGMSPSDFRKKTKRE